MRRACEPFGDIETFDPLPLLHRIGEARVVLIGEATHGTSEFYRLRARITQALIEAKGFRFVAIHRPFRADEWLLFDQRVESTGRGRSRGVARGRFLTKPGELVATCMQEGLIRWGK